MLPDGSPAPLGVTAGAGSGRSRFNAISSDGSRIVFTTPADGQIYVRLDGATTRAVSASQKTIPDPSPSGATFWGASSDGSSILFTTTDQLLDSDTDGRSDLYRYVTSTGTLERVTQGGDVYEVLGLAQDLSYVYFMAVESGTGRRGRRDEPVRLA